MVLARINDVVVRLVSLNQVLIGSRLAVYFTSCMRASYPLLVGLTPRLKAGDCADRCSIQLADRSEMQRSGPNADVTPACSAMAADPTVDHLPAAEVRSEVRAVLHRRSPAQAFFAPGARPSCAPSPCASFPFGAFGMWLSRDLLEIEIGRGFRRRPQTLRVSDYQRGSRGWRGDSR